MKRFGILAMIGLLSIPCTTIGQTQDKKIEMIPVKYDGLKQEVLKQRGKVVVVDFWAGY
jgi:hypothetical protein